MSRKITSSCAKFKNYCPNNMVMVVRWDGKIRLADVFECLPLLVVESPPLMKGKKITIPYYGVDRVIVSLRYKKRARGLRKPPKNTDNFVSVDFQVGERNVHIKLSINNALVMGVTSEKEGVEAVERLLDMINMADVNVEIMRESSEEQRNLIRQFIENMSSDDELGLGLPPAKTFRSKVEKWNKKNEEKIDEHLAMIYLVYAYETFFYEDFVNMTDRIFKSKKMDEQLVNISTTEVSNSAYTYKLCFEEQKGDKMGGIFIFKNLAQCVINLEDPSMTATHHNWHYKYVNIVFRDDDDRIHRFNLSEGGSVRQWSPSSVKDAFRIHNRLLSVLNKITSENDEVFVDIAS